MLNKERKKKKKDWVERKTYNTCERKKEIMIGLQYKLGMHAKERKRERTRKKEKLKN